jgi:hypothetical protein
MQKEVLAMKRKYWLLLLVFAVHLNGSPVLADGDFYVIAGGGRVGTRITSVPYTINAPGFYYLEGDLNTGLTAITVNADHVTIDLMGFSLNRNAFSEVLPSGILMDGRNNVEIRNGTVRGFSKGILENSAGGANHRVSNVRVVSCLTGIQLLGKNHLVRNCNASNNILGISVKSGVITGCLASDNGDLGIGLDGPGSLIGNTVICNSGQRGFWISNNEVLVDQNTASGDGTTYEGGGSKVVWAGKNADNPWGSNAGHP